MINEIDNTEEQKELIKKQTAEIADIIMRIVDGKPAAAVFNALCTTVAVIANGSNKDGKLFIGTGLADLAEKIINSIDNVEVTQ